MKLKGVFETLRVEDGKIELLSSHLKRLSWQCQEGGFAFPPLSEKDVKRFVVESDAQKGTWRLNIIVSRQLEMKISPYVPLPLRPLSLCMYPKCVAHSFSHLKCLDDISRKGIKPYAHAGGYDDALTVSPEGWLLEAAYANLFWVIEGQLYTPHHSLPLLSGIMLEQVVKSFANVHEVRTANVPDGAHVYLCNSMMHVRPVGSIGDRTFPFSEIRLPFIS